jgi:lysophospholipase L1-like esterase
MTPLAVLSLVTVLAGSPVPAATDPPSSMASLGDSITRGFNACGFYVDCPNRSYATGTDPAVNSHYLRIRSVNPAIRGHVYNDAKSGSTAADVPGQASAAVGMGVQYVTILIGANDACAGDEASMTSVDTFRGYLDTALDRLKAGLPAGAKVLVISIPDLRRLWQVGKDNSAARTAWQLLHMCQSMLANPASTAAPDVQRRERVRQRVVDYNTQLAQACAGYGPDCRFDGNAVFNYPFSLAQVSTWDYFHPNADGQTALAQVSDTAGYGWAPAPW